MPARQCFAARRNDAPQTKLDECPQQIRRRNWIGLRADLLDFVHDGRDRIIGDATDQAFEEAIGPDRRPWRGRRRRRWWWCGRRWRRRGWRRGLGRRSLFKFLETLP